MLNLNFHKTQGPLRVLCLGAHSDDIEIGCGGAILRLLRENKKIEFYWVVFSASPEREKEARKSAARFLQRSQNQTTIVKNFRDGFFPYVGAQIKDYFEEIKHSFAPDLVFTHYRNDRHQDHRLISELTWNTFRNHLILEYEIPKYDGDLGHPNFFVPLTETICRKKLKLLHDGFPSQHENHWFTDETFLSILRIRGIESLTHRRNMLRPSTVGKSFSETMKKQHMNMKLIARKFTLGIVAAVCCFLFSGCEYEVPVTTSPTRKIDEKLLGDWVSKDGKVKMKVRRLDDSIYIVSLNGGLSRAYHSDVAKTSFVSVQDIDSAERKYAYVTWKLSEDGKQLALRVVSDKVIPKETKDSASVQKLLEKNLQNAELLGDEAQFTKAQ